MSGKLDPFTISVADDVLLDLRERLNRTRWPSQADLAPWTFGADLDYMKDFVRHWAHAYDWRLWERRLNSFANYRVRIGDQDLHFIMEKGSGSNPRVLLLLHGWPSSVIEFLDVIEPLAHPERFGGNAKEGFTVVVPSLPGFGFSSAPRTPLTPSDIATTMSRLMSEALEQKDYVVQGGDWGGIIASWMAVQGAAGLRALLLSGQGLGGGHSRPEPADNPLSEEEQEWLTRDAERKRQFSSYQQVQGYDSQSLAYGLYDSPAALAAWIVTRFHDWTVGKSAAPPPFDRDRLITNIMLYWLSGANAPNWLYVSIVNGQARALPPRRTVTLPTGLVFCPNDNTVPPPRRWMERVFSNIRHFEVTDTGGHFFAFEQPELFVETTRRFFRSPIGRDGTTMAGAGD